MLELKKAGLYIANGKNTSVLVRVTGEFPMLEIISGVLLNDMERDGTVTKLTKEDPEIQDILCNPKNYVFDYPTVSKAVSCAQGLDTKGERKYVEFKQEEFEDWVNQYIQNKTMYPDNYEVKTIAHLIGEGYSKSQSDMIIKQIVTRLRLQGKA